MLKIIRDVRDVLFAVVTHRRKSVNVSGVILSLEGLSSRMRYVLHRGYEKDDAALASEFLRPDDRVLECGASLGFMALHCLKNIGIQDIALVEANPHMEQIIEENFRLNGLEPPRLLICAVGAHDGSVSFGISKNSWSSSIFERDAEVERIQIPQKTIPSILNDLEFKPNVLVMDVEGAEVGIPREHFDYFERIILEIHPKISGHESTQDLLSSLRELGFSEEKRASSTLFLVKTK